MTIGDIVMYALFESVAWNDGIKHKALKETNQKTIEKNSLTKKWADRMKKHFEAHLDSRPKPRPPL